MRPWLRSVISTLSPVSRMRFGISITDSGSVQSTSSLSPGGNVFSALRVFNAGKRAFQPGKIEFCRGHVPNMAKGLLVNDGP